MSSGENDAQLLKSVGAFLERQYGLLEECTETDSPIEAMLFRALSIVGEFHDHFYLSIQTQHKLGDYRADFLVMLIPKLTVHEQLAGDRCPHCNRQLTGTKKKKYCSKSCYYKSQTQEENSMAIIECDGHEFHEKTKTQAKRDKKRDRFIQSQGFNVLHFTGSEIWNDAIGCAEEVIEFLRQKRAMY